MQAQVALDGAFREKYWPNSTLKSQPNLFVFPSLGAANISYQLVARVAGIDEIGPVLLGIKRPVTVVPPQAPVNSIVQMTAMTALHAIKGSHWARATIG
jgi:malate dehydrogenase (oxaloacetate-decarboxylating)(NADP+)